MNSFNRLPGVSALVLGSLACALCLSSLSHAADRAVPSQFPTIQSAIDACVDGDRVLVSPGTYGERINLRGKRITVEGALGPSVTLIDLANIGGGTAITATSGEPQGCTIKGISLRGGTTSLVLVSGANLSVRNCRIESSTAGAAGGAGIRCSGGVIEVSETVFTSLRASVDAVRTANVSGGAVLLSSESSARFSGCSFANCSARASGGNDNDITCSTPVGYEAQGGAIAAHASAVDVSGCSFASCEVTAERTFGWGCYWNCAGPKWIGVCAAKGGAIAAVAGSALEVRNSQFASCCATHRNRWDPGAGYCGACRAWIGYASGAAVFVDSSACAVEDSQVSNGQCRTAFPWSGNPSTPGGGNFPGGCPDCGPSIVGTRCGAGIAISGPLPSQATISRCSFVGGETRVVTSEGESEGGQAASNVYTRCQSVTAWRPCELLWNSSGVSVGLGANAAVSDCQFSGGTTAAQAIVDGASATFIRCSFSSPQVPSSGIRSVGSSPVIFACSFRGASGAAVVSDGPGATGPIVSYSQFCGNGVNGIVGPWTDGGSNTFIATCVDNDCNGNGIDDSADIASGFTPDCNSNGVPDGCDIASGSAVDCNGNGIPDPCELPVERRQSSSLSPVQYGTLLTTSFTQVKRSGTPVTLRFVARADLSDAIENIQAKMNGTVIGTLWQTGGADCAEVTAELVISAEAFNAAVDSASGSISFVFSPSFAVTAGQCASSSLVVAMEYLPISQGDCNGNGNPDSCDVGDGISPDVNGNGVPDECEDLPCTGDLNADGTVNGQDLGFVLGAWGAGATSPADLNRDGVVNGLDLGVLLGSWGGCP